MQRFFKVKYGYFMMALYLVFSIFAAGCGFLQQATQTQGQPQAAGKLEIKMLDIGQGDAILIRTPVQTVLVDTGDVDQRENLVQILKREGVTTIDKLIISHPHADHLGGAMGVLTNFKVQSVYDNGQTTTTATYRKYIKKITEQKITYQQLLEGETLDFGEGVRFEVFSPSKKEVQSEKDLNMNSIVGKLSYGEFSMIFTGDCEADREKAIVKRYSTQLKSLILKSPHHGSKTSSNQAFLKAVAPETVLVSCGNGNEYGHPHEPVMNRYKKMGLQIYRTDQDGTLTVVSDGKSYQVKKEKGKA